MKARNFILTSGAVFALVVPVAQAANTSNRLFQTRMHTILAERNTQAGAKSAKSSRYYQTWVHTVGADKSVGPIGQSRPQPKSQPMPPQSPASSRR